MIPSSPTIQTVQGFTLVVLIWLTAGACQSVPPPSAKDFLIGKTSAQVQACAGQPLGEVEVEGVTALTYYQEAPMMERSSVYSKGSRTLRAHGCRAKVLLKGDRVAEVQFIAIPEALSDYDHCEEVFERCAK